MASRGLAAVYNLADGPTRQALVDALMGTLSGAVALRMRRSACGACCVCCKLRSGDCPDNCRARWPAGLLPWGVPKQLREGFRV